MVKIILGVLSLLVMLSCSTAVKENTTQSDRMETNKKNLGNLLALYPKPMTVVGAEVEGKVNWLVVGHTGVIGHDRILVSMSKSSPVDAGPFTELLDGNTLYRLLLEQAGKCLTDQHPGKPGSLVASGHVFSPFPYRTRQNMMYLFNIVQSGIKLIIVCCTLRIL